MTALSNPLAEAEHHLAQRHLPEAFALFARAELQGADPGQVYAGRWQAHMLQGSFEQAWQQSDAIRALNQPDPHRFWQGEDLRNRRVIVRCLHGFGDAVQMFRFAPRLRALAAQVTWEVPPSLHAIAPHFTAVENVVAWGDRAPAQSPSWDVQVECTELPYLFRTQSGDLPVAANYLRLPQALEMESAKTMGPKTRPRIGLVWTAGEWNPERNVPVSALAPLAHQPDIELWNLQGGPARRDITLAYDATKVCGEGILPLAATIANLELVITVDTLAAHLAGALGKPTWLLLQHAADWRWMTDRTDTPWYPALRLFRQPRPGDWLAVIQSVCTALQEAHPSPRPRSTSMPTT